MEAAERKVEVCRLAELAPGSVRRVALDGVTVGVFNCAGKLYAIEDRCSHDDGSLVDGELDEDACTIECPRHGSLFGLADGCPRTLPAYEPVTVYEVSVVDDVVVIAY